MPSVLDTSRPILLCAAPGIPVLGPSGASAHVRGVAEALRPVAVVAALRADRRGEHERLDLPIIETGVPGWPSWLSGFREYTEVLAARRVARAAVALHPTLIWERYALFSDAGWKVHAATGAPFLLEVNAPLLEERRRFETLRRPRWAATWEREVLLAAPAVAAVSQWLVDWLRAEIGCTNVLHLPNGVAPHRGDRDATRQRLGVTDRFVIGFLGSMKPWHGVERLVELLEVFPDAVGLCVGDGPVQLSHPRLIQLGQVPEAATADYVAAMDIGLAPYRTDAPPWFCPLKILAYRAQGTPVVAADVGDCRLLTGDGGTVGEDFRDAILAWRGRRATPSLRSWSTVVGEGLGFLGATHRP